MFHGNTTRICRSTNRSSIHSPEPVASAMKPLLSILPPSKTWTLEVARSFSSEARPRPLCSSNGARMAGLQGDTRCYHYRQMITFTNERISMEVIIKLPQGRYRAHFKSVSEILARKIYQPCRDSPGWPISGRYYDSAHRRACPEEH